MKEQLYDTDFCLGMDDEPTETLWVRRKEQTSIGDIVDICYRPPDLEEQVDEARSNFTFTGHVCCELLQLP